jgi:hypothetical protein
MPAAGTGRLTLKTVTPHHVTPDLLRQVPFVNPNAWTSVGLEGTTAAQLDLTINRATDQVTYHLSMQPTGTTVTIPTIGLQFTDATGGLTAEGAVVTLSDVRGKSAGGEVLLNSRMDFGGADSELRFMADLTDMDVKGLPNTWRLPPELDGRLTGKLEFNVTLPAAGGTKVEAAGKATIADARVRGRPVPPIELHVATITGGGVRFAEPATEPGKHEVLKPPEPGPKPAPQGAKAARARRSGLASTFLKFAARVVKPANAPKEDKAYLHLNVAFRDVDVAELLKSAGVDVPVKVAGKVSLQVQLDIPTETPDELKSYRMAGVVTSRRVTVDELAVEGLSAKLDLKDGKLAVKDFAGRLPALGGNGAGGGSFQARGEMEVGKAYPFKGSVLLDKVALGHVEQLKNLLPLNVPLAGEATAHANVEGSLSPVAVKTNGDADVQRLRVGSVPADDLTFRWESDGPVVRFRDVSAKLFGGEVSGELDVPVRDDVAGTGSLKLQNLDLGELLKGVMPGSNLKLEGKAAGTVKVRSPAAGEGEARGATAELDLQAPAMKLQGVPARKIKGTAQYAAGVLKYTLAGEAFGGTFEVAGQYPPAGKKGAAPAEKKEPPKKDNGLDLGRIKLRRMQLSRLWDVVGLKNALGPLDADVSGDFPLTTDDAGRLIGTGRLRAERLRWSGREIAANGQTVVRLTSTEMIFDEVTFFVGEGVVRAKVTINREDVNRSTGEMTLSNVPARRLFFLVPELGGRFDLNVDGRLTTTMGRDWRGSGVLTAGRGKAYGIPVADVRLPLDWTVVPDTGRTQVRVRDLTATAAGGPVTGRAEVSLVSDAPPKFSGNLQFRNVNLSQAFREAGQFVGNLPLSGKLDFGSDHYRGPNDLTARLDARLGESQPLSLPLFRSLVPYITPGFSSNQTIRAGEGRATLAGGVWRIEKLTLTGNSLDLYADGTVTTGGGIQLAVTAASRQTPGQVIIQRIVPLSVLTATPSQTIAQSVLADALGIIGTYVVHLEVTGTINSPVIRIETLRTLTEDAIRFFLLRWALRR